MGKVKQAVQEVQEEIQEIVYFWKGDISLDDIKTILTVITRSTETSCI